ncbi:hypothetical protein [Streptomyces sp. NPDC057579]|uniref:hypothetical protein n=1 Tax=Streptomyces sp. NPDC057579 TaxID=3346172 RepID=UPI0036C658A6
MGELDDAVVPAEADVGEDVADPNWLLERATASLSTPTHMSEVERLLFNQALATALANALAPALANALAAEITKVLQVPSGSGGKESASTSGSQPHGGSGDGPHSPGRE